MTILDIESCTLDEYRQWEPLYDQAREFASAEATMSISKMQRRLQIGYNRAARLCERLEKDGVLVHNRSEHSWRRAVNGSSAHD